MVVFGVIGGVVMERETLRLRPRLAGVTQPHLVVLRAMFWCCGGGEVRGEVECAGGESMVRFVCRSGREFEVSACLWISVMIAFRRAWERWRLVVVCAGGVVGIGCWQVVVLVMEQARLRGRLVLVIIKINKKKRKNNSLTNVARKNSKRVITAVIECCYENY